VTEISMTATSSRQSADEEGKAWKSEGEPVIFSSDSVGLLVTGPP